MVASLSAFPKTIRPANMSHFYPEVPSNPKPSRTTQTKVDNSSLEIVGAKTCTTDAPKGSRKSLPMTYCASSSSLLRNARLSSCGLVTCRNLSVLPRDPFAGTASHTGRCRKITLYVLARCSGPCGTHPVAGLRKGRWHRKRRFHNPEPGGTLCVAPERRRGIMGGLAVLRRLRTLISPSAT